MLGEEPDDGDDGVEQGQDEQAPLEQDAQVMLVRRAGEAAGRQRVEGRGAAEGDEPGGRHGEHVREGSGREGLGGQAADDEDRDGLQRVLEGVG